MGAHLYGHNPPPTITKREEEIYQLLDDLPRPTTFIRKHLPHISKESIYVALVRLRNRGMVESMDEEYTKPTKRPAKLWKRA